MRAQPVREPLWQAARAVSNLWAELDSRGVLLLCQCVCLQPPVLQRCRQLHKVVQTHRAEAAARDAERACRAAAGILSKTAQAAVSFVGSVASSVLPGVGGSNSVGSVQEPSSLELLREAGVAVETEEMEGGADSGYTGWLTLRWRCPASITNAGTRCIRVQDTHTACGWWARQGMWGRSAVDWVADCADWPVRGGLTLQYGCGALCLQVRA